MAVTLCGQPAVRRREEDALSVCRPACRATWEDPQHRGAGRAGGGECADGQRRYLAGSHSAQHPQGVQGIGPARRLEIHNLGLAVEQLDADIVCLQEVRGLHRRGGPVSSAGLTVPQAEFRCPRAARRVYRTNAFTKHGEHGNALPTRLAGHRPPA